MYANSIKKMTTDWPPGEWSAVLRAHKPTAEQRKMYAEIDAAIESNKKLGGMQDLSDRKRLLKKGLHTKKDHAEFKEHFDNVWDT